VLLFAVISLDIRLTILGGGAIASNCYWLKIAVRLAVDCRTVLQFTTYRGLRVETASDVLPQVQLIVIDGLQYAVLAKCVNGANVLTIAELSVAILF
jgi:hypothetical protein